MSANQQDEVKRVDTSLQSIKSKPYFYCADIVNLKLCKDSEFNRPINDFWVVKLQEAMLKNGVDDTTNPMVVSTKLKKEDVVKHCQENTPFQCNLIVRSFFFKCDLKI